MNRKCEVQRCTVLNCIVDSCVCASVIQKRIWWVKRGLSLHKSCLTSQNYIRRSGLSPLISWTFWFKRIIFPVFLVHVKQISCNLTWMNLRILCHTQEFFRFFTIIYWWMTNICTCFLRPVYLNFFSIWLTVDCVIDVLGSFKPNKLYHSYCSGSISIPNHN